MRSHTLFSRVVTVALRYRTGVASFVLAAVFCAQLRGAPIPPITADGVARWYLTLESHLAQDHFDARTRTVAEALSLSAGDLRKKDTSLSPRAKAALSGIEQEAANITLAGGLDDARTRFAFLSEASRVFFSTYYHGGMTFFWFETEDHRNHWFQTSYDPLNPYVGADRRFTGHRVR